MKPNLVSGFVVDASSKYWRREAMDHPNVTLIQLGRGTIAWLTPNEARELAELLQEAATEAEKRQ